MFNFSTATHYGHAGWESIRRLAWIIVLFFCATAAAPAQTPDSARVYFVGARWHIGKIIVDNPGITSLLDGPPYMAEVHVSRLKNEQRVWNYANCYVKDGLGLSYINFRNADVLGHAFSAAVYTEPIIVNAARFQLSLRCGAGLSYLNKIYNATTNADNIYYSQHLSFLLFVNPTLYYSLNTQWRLTANAQISHISNGGATWPNWGINLLSAGVGVEYALQPLALKRRPRIPFTDRGIKAIVHAFAGRHTSDPTTEYASEKKFAGGLNVGIVKPLGRVCALGLGTEWYYDGIASVLEAQQAKHYNPVIGSVSIQNYFFFGRLLFGQQFAWHVLPDHPYSQKFYQVYSLEYKIKGPLYAGILLHARGNVSDFLSIATAYVF